MGSVTGAYMPASGAVTLTYCGVDGCGALWDVSYCGWEKRAGSQVSLEEDSVLVAKPIKVRK